MSVHMRPPAPSRAAAGLLLPLLPATAFAHHAIDRQSPEGIVQGLLSGLAHPLIEPVHLLFLLVLGTGCALSSARRLHCTTLLVLCSLMGALSFARLPPFSFVESLLGLSLFGIGLLLLRAFIGARPLLAFTAIAAVLHGYAYGGGAPGAVGLTMAGYLLGLAAAQATVLTATGVVLDRARQRSEGQQRLLQRVVGGVGCLAGGAAFLLA